MPAPPELVYPVVPKCDTGHRGPDRVAEQTNCPRCIARKRYTDRIRTWEIRHGERPKRQPPAVDRKAHRCPEHGRYVKGCADCREWSRYEAAVRRDRERRGVAEHNVPVEVVQKHLSSLLDKNTGGWKLRQIADRSGISLTQISVIRNGRVKTVIGSTWNALRVLKPTGQPPVYLYHRGQVASLESARIVQGLLAQAWTPTHMAGLLGHSSDDSVLLIARHRREFMRPGTREAVRGLLDKLGPYNGLLMTELLPGMDLAAAGRALNRGYVPIAAWAGQDLADPDAVPGRRPATPAGIPADDDGTPRGGDMIIPVDEVKLARVRAIHELILDTDAHGAYRVDGFIRSIGRMTQLEKYVLVAYATHLGMSAAETAETIGYPAGTDRQIETGQRAVCRILADVRAALALIEKHPAGRTPPWLLAYDIRMSSYLPALLAMQPAPVGRGMSVEQLAAWCGVTDDVLHQYLARAARRANGPWDAQPSQHRGSCRRPQPTRTHAA